MSLLFALCGRHRVVVAADSRRMREDGVALDDTDKLFPCGHFTACGISGVTNLGTHTIVSELIEEISSRPSLRDSPQALLEAITEEMGPRLTRVFREKPLPDGHASAFSAFVARKQPTGELDLLELEFRITTFNGGKRTLDEPRVIAHAEGPPLGRIAYSLGHGDYLTQALEQRLDPDAGSDADILTGVDAIFDGAMVESRKSKNDVGGPIDVALIDAAGFRWLRRK
jgi:hypothetical protein